MVDATDWIITVYMDGCEDDLDGGGGSMGR